MANPLKAIVVGVIEPDPEDPALHAALDMSRRSGATVHAVHAFDLPVAVTAPHAITYTGTQGVQQYLEEVRHAFDERMRAYFREDAVVGHALPGPADAAIRQVAEEVDADLVVVGATHRGRVGRLLLGTTAQRVLRASPSPVLIVRTWPVNTHRVLLATDLTPASATVYERALDLLDALYDLGTAEVRALVAVLSAPAIPPLTPALLERAAAEELAAFIGRRRTRAYQVHPALRVGAPAAEIVAEARTWPADLVILGTHARSTPLRWLVGSVAEAAIRDLHTNVLAVPPLPEPAPAPQLATAAQAPAGEGS